ncbi:hypothetical protein LINGRAHAP2_LOCUS10786 [Linum grandiflorum]
MVESETSIRDSLLVSLGAGFDATIAVVLPDVRSYGKVVPKTGPQWRAKMPSAPSLEVTMTDVDENIAAPGIAVMGPVEGVDSATRVVEGVSAEPNVEAPPSLQEDHVFETSGGVEQVQPDSEEDLVEEDYNEFDSTPPQSAPTDQPVSVGSSSRKATFGDYLSQGTLGKIWLVWKQSMVVTVLVKTSQLIHVEVDQVFYTFVYADTSVVRRRELFLELVTLVPHGRPWIVSGDFNAILSLDEASNTPSSFLGMDDFRECVLSCALMEHPYVGPKYTWTNNRVEDPIARHLDRVLVNVEWSTAFSASRVSLLPCSESDHCAILAESSTTFSSYPKPFKFFSCWAGHPDFDAIVGEPVYSSVVAPLGL